MSFQGFQLDSTFSCGGLRLRSFHSWNQVSTDMGEANNKQQSHRYRAQEPSHPNLEHFEDEIRFQDLMLHYVCSFGTGIVNTGLSARTKPSGREISIGNCSYLQK